MIFPPPKRRLAAGAACLILITSFIAGCAAADDGTGSQPSSTPCPTPLPESATAGFCGTAPTQSVFTDPTEVVAPAGPQAVGPVVETAPQAEPTKNEVRTTPPAATSAAAPAVATPAPCAAEQCFQPGALLFTRPIQPPGQDSIDATYRFGSTQEKKRDPHHGVEFLNGYGTPVIAAGDGKVVVAGDDIKTIYGPYPNFYGNLVVIEHDLPGFTEPVYSLYGHLSEVLVRSGQSVRRGEEIGKVGMSGVATGSHLHFEVRPGENSYAASSNPELWLMPHQDQDGQLHGALAGRVVDRKGNPIAVEGVVIQHLPLGESERADWEIYLDSYEEKALLGRAPWYESFGAGDLPAGAYRISFPHSGLQQRVVQVLPGQLTVVNFEFDW